MDAATVQNVLANANQTILFVLKSLEGTQAEEDWDDAIVIIESQLVMVRNMLDSAHWQVVPSLLIATEKHWKWEEGDWPDMQAIIKCSEEDLRDHPWYRMGRTTVSPPKAPSVDVIPASIPQGRQASSNPAAPPEKDSSRISQEQDHPPSQDPAPALTGPQTLRPTMSAPLRTPSPDAEGPGNIPAHTGCRKGRPLRHLRPGSERTWRYCSVHEQVERACARCIVEGVLCVPIEGRACKPCKFRKRQCPQAASIRARSHARSPANAPAPAPGSSAVDANRTVESEEPYVATGLQPGKSRLPSRVANKRKTPTDTRTTDDECLAATGRPERIFPPPPSRAAVKRKRPAITDDATVGLAKKPRSDTSPLPETISSAALTATSTGQLQCTSQQAGLLDNGSLRPSLAYAVGSDPFITRDEFQRLERSVDQLRNRLTLYARVWESIPQKLAYLLRVPVMSDDDDRGA